MTTLRSISTLAAILALAGTALGQIPADQSVAAPQQYAPDSFPTLNPQQLDQLLGPIALYPDPLIAQILPAATYPIDIVRASRFVRSGGAADQIDLQDWDPSVRAVAHYPSVIQMMDDSIAWTQQLGQAFLSQPEDVMQSVQRLRAQAQNFGNLPTNDQQQIFVQDSAIRIVPTNPDIVYIPSYQPAVVYYQSAPLYSSFISFGYGYSSGSWLDLDCDWNNHWFYRPGWSWNRWHDHYTIDRGRFLQHRNHVGFDHRQRPSNIWRRDDHRPLTFPGHRLTNPSDFDRSRGRDRGSDRGGDHGVDRGNRGLDRGLDRGGDRRSTQPPIQRPDNIDRGRTNLPQPRVTPFDHTQRGLQRAPSGGTTFTPQRSSQTFTPRPAPSFTPQQIAPSAPRNTRPAPSLAPRDIRPASPSPAPARLSPSPARVNPAPARIAPSPAPASRPSTPARPQPQPRQDNTQRGLNRGDGHR